MSDEKAVEIAARIEAFSRFVAVLAVAFAALDAAVRQAGLSARDFANALDLGDLTYTRMRFDYRHVSGWEDCQ